MKKSVFPYFGSKFYHTEKILAEMPSYACYVEPFGGAANVLIAKPPKMDIYNDIDGEVVNFFRVLRDPAQYMEFKRICGFTPYSRLEFESLRDMDIPACPVKQAWRFFCMKRMSIMGLGTSFAICTGARRNRAKTLNNLAYLDVIIERFKKVIIENLDFRELIPRYDRAGTLFYCDPPYVPETRVGGGYTYEMTRADHEDLVEILQAVKGKVMLSGYQNDLYDGLGWRVVKWKTNTSGGRLRDGIVNTRTECLYMNYDALVTQEVLF